MNDGYLKITWEGGCKNNIPMSVFIEVKYDETILSFKNTEKCIEAH